MISVAVAEMMLVEVAEMMLVEVTIPVVEKNLNSNQSLT
jgi:hypothetical protein